jgi:hypothetical protein
VRVESIDTGPSRFSLLASYTLGAEIKDEATLLLSDGRWVVRSDSRQLLELVLGVPLSAMELRGVLTGCPQLPSGDLKVEQFDPATIKVTIGSGRAAIELFLRRNHMLAPWELFAMSGTVPGRPVSWRADPGERSHGVLESVRLRSLWNERTDKRFDLNVSFDRLQTPAGSAELLSLSIPESVETIAIDELRSHVSTPLVD